MKKLACLLLVVLGCTSLAFSQAATMPSLLTQPAAPPQLKVLVIPFASTGGGNLNWVGQSLDENVAIDVSVDSGMEVIDSKTAVFTPAQAIDAGKNAGATLVVFGSYGYSNGNLRVTGEVLDVLNGRALAGLTAAGPLADFVKIEDAISAELDDALPQQAGTYVPIAVNGYPFQPTYGYVAPSGYGSYPGDVYADAANLGPLVNSAYPVPPIYGEGGGDFGFGGFYGGGYYGGGGYHAGFHGGFHGGGFHGGFHGAAFHGGGGHGR